MTLCYIENGDQILLAMKKQGLGIGYWNGYGGKVEEGESIEDAAIREVKEEVGMTVKVLEKRGVMNFSFAGKEIQPEVHIFKVIDCEGEPQESEEMKPQWFDKTEVPYEQMWSGDVLWFPIFLEGKRFVGICHFDENKKVVRHEIKVVDSV